MFCKKCGAKYPEDATKCPVCEAEIEAVKPATETVEEVIETVENTVIPAVKKSKKPLWTIIAAAVVVIVAAAIFGIASNLTYTNAADERASVYVITKKGMDRVYAKVGDKEAVLVKELGENETFAENSEFVVKNNNIYFLNDDGGLSIMNMKNGKTKQIGDDFKAGTLVLSAKGNTILYAGEDGMLFKSTRGGKAEEIADIGQSKFANGLPNYGFVEGTNSAWFAPLEKEAVEATVYLESGEVVAEKAAAIFHVGNNDKKFNAVYITVTKEETVQPEPVEGEEAETVEPIITRTYALMINEEGNEPLVLNDNYVNSDSVSILHKEHKGVLYIADKGEVPTDPETGEITGVATGTLYFYEFGGEKVALETGVSVAIVLDEISGSNYFFDASDRAEDETIAYMKDNTISLIRDMKKVENPAELEFLSSTPVFEHGNTFMLYKTYNPAPAAAEGEEATQTEAEPTKLVYTNLVDGAWTDYTVVAENVVDYNYDPDGGIIYYLLDESGDVNRRTLYSYTVENGETVKCADDVLGYVTFNNEGKNLYYIHGFNTETQIAAISHMKNGETKLIAETVNGCLITEDGTPYVVVPNGEDSDIYFADGDKLSLVCKKMTRIIYAR